MLIRIFNSEYLRKDLPKIAVALNAKIYVLRYVKLWEHINI